MRQVAPASHQQLQRVVEARRIGALFPDERFQLLDAITPKLRTKLRLSGSHPVAVRRECVDFTVVSEHTKRLSQEPIREGVRGVTLMNDGERGLKSRIAKVLIKGFELRADEQAFVDDRPT